MRRKIAFYVYCRLPIVQVNTVSLLVPVISYYSIPSLACPLVVRAQEKGATGSISPWWRHQMETFSMLLALCEGNSPVNSSHKGQWRGALMFSLNYVWIKRLSKQSWGWCFERPSRSLRRHCNVNSSPLDKMAAFSQAIFSDAFREWNPIDNNQALVQIMVLAPNRRRAVIWTNADLIYWRIYVVRGGDELNEKHL